MKIILTPQHTESLKNDYRYVQLSKLMEFGIASCSDIVCNDVIDYISFDKRDQIFQQIIARLKYKGIVHLCGFDYILVCQAYEYNKINTQQLNQILYNGKQSIINLTDIVEMCERYDLEILKRDIEKYKYIVSAMRKSPNESNN